MSILSIILIVLLILIFLALLFILVNKIKQPKPDEDAVIDNNNLVGTYTGELSYFLFPSVKGTVIIKPNNLLDLILETPDLTCTDQVYELTGNIIKFSPQSQCVNDNLKGQPVEIKNIIANDIDSTITIIVQGVGGFLSNISTSVTLK